MTRIFAQRLALERAASSTLVLRILRFFSTAMASFMSCLPTMYTLESDIPYRKYQKIQEKLAFRFFELEVKSAWHWGVHSSADSLAVLSALSLEQSAGSEKKLNVHQCVFGLVSKFVAYQAQYMSSSTCTRLPCIHMFRAI
eukprot:scpid90541/ scgid5125/ 